MAAQLKMALTPAEAVSDAVFPAAGPDAPTLIRPLPHKPMRFPDLQALARHIHGLRGTRGLEFSPVAFASYAGSVTFPGFNLSIVDTETQATDWIGFVAIQSNSPTPLQDALRDALKQAAPAGGSANKDALKQPARGAGGSANKDGDALKQATLVVGGSAQDGAVAT
jgi:hypothetical protein